VLAILSREKKSLCLSFLTIAAWDRIDGNRTKTAQKWKGIRTANKDKLSVVNILLDKFSWAFLRVVGSSYLFCNNLQYQSKRNTVRNCALRHTEISLSTHGKI